jgi:hypothetical protein
MHQPSSAALPVERAPSTDRAMARAALDGEHVRLWLKPTKSGSEVHPGRAIARVCWTL